MFLPDNIDLADSKKYILSIRLFPNGFYFSVHCPTKQTLLYQNSISFSTDSNYLKSLEKLIFDYSFFSYNYQQINVICVEDETTIVPNEFYNKKHESDFLSYNYMNPKQHVTSNELHEHNCRIIWPIDKSVHSFLCRALLNPRFINHLSPLISLFYMLHKKDTAALFVNFNNNNMIDIVAFLQDKLILAKTFSSNSVLEESYYIQKTWEALEFNTQTDYLNFTGKTNEHAECIESLNKIVAKSETLSINVSHGTEINGEEVPTEILNQLCEL